MAAPMKPALAVRTDMALVYLSVRCGKRLASCKRGPWVPAGCKQRTVYRCRTPYDSWFDVANDRASGSFSAPKGRVAASPQREFFQTPQAAPDRAVTG